MVTTTKHIIISARNNIVEIGRQTHQRQMLLAAAAHAAAANVAAVHSFSSPSHDTIKFRKIEEKEHMPSNLYPKILDRNARCLPPLPQLPENISVTGITKSINCT